MGIKNILSIIALAGFIVLTGLTTMAQDIRRVEFYGGYQFHNISTGLGDVNDKIGEDIFDNRITAHGFNASITGNLTKMIGIKFDYATTGRALLPDFSDETDLKLRVNQYLGGVQIKNNEVDGPRFKPFAHILAGVANERIRCTQGCDLKIATPTGEGGTSTSSFSESTSSFAMVFGGGLDVRVHPRIDIRVIQLDYNPIFYGGNDNLDLEGRTQNNFRIGFGIVIH
ncbi:MAG: hypothetical protein ACJ72Z_10955 [Pyrinomonadaceae bacterium]